MSIKNNIKMKNETILLIVGSLLLIISFLLIHYEKILEVANSIYTDIQSQIYKETSGVSVNVNVNYIDNENQINNNNSNNQKNYTSNYIAFLEIDKIYLKQGLLPIDNYYNKVDYHVEILKTSDFPDVLNGNFILAAHSGSGSIAYFKNLYKLQLGDIAKVIYNGKKYIYKIVNIYKEDKDGSIGIYRDKNKTTLTLITCSKNDKTHQTVYILELTGVEGY